MALSAGVMLPRTGIVVNTATLINNNHTHHHHPASVVSSSRAYMKHGEPASVQREHLLVAFVAASSVAVSCATWTPPAQSSALPIDESVFVPAKIAEFHIAYTQGADTPVKAPKLKDDGSSNCTISPVGAAQQPIPKEVTNDSLIDEAWQVIYERFLDARNHKWSPDAWLKKREDVLNEHAESRLAAYGVIRNMLSELGDPYSRFITPRELKQLSKYDMTGIGISLGEIGADNNVNKLRVVGVIIGSPAQMAGIKQGDELLSVNGIDVNGKSAFDASSLIQGHKGTTVSLQFRRELCNDILSVTVERQQSMRSPVYYRLEKFEDNILGYIRLKEFNAVAKRDIVTAINKMIAAGATSILLDLRDNPGGLVQAGVEIAKVFLDEGKTILYTVSSDPVIQKHVLANGPPLTRSPLMVLVNEHTASASEIVAAALHDNCRAVLVGRRTFGKGLIQSVFELGDGSGVILTVGKYVTPNHQDIDQNGISPDFQNIPRLADLKKQIDRCSSSFR